MAKKSDHKIIGYPLSRLFSMDMGYLGTRKHHVKALIEVDVTVAKKTIRHLRHGKKIKISFFSWFIKCIATAISLHPQIHSIRKGMDKLIMFDDVDISIIVEKEVYGMFVPIPLIIRKTNEKSIEDIYTEIKKARSQEIVDERDYVLNTKYNMILMKLFIVLPQFIRIFLWKLMLKNPFLLKKNMGTVMVTETGSFGLTNGWVLPVSIHPVCFALSSIGKQPDTEKETLKLTVLIDHDVVDGGKAVIFAKELTRMIESGFGLIEK